MILPRKTNFFEGSPWFIQLFGTGKFGKMDENIWENFGKSQKFGS